MIDFTYCRRARLAFLSAALLVAGCDRKPHPSAQGSEPSGVPAPAAKAPVESSPQVQTLATPQEVEHAVERWVSLQNKADVEGYRALYASKFTGVKRSGEREARFDREGWMKDRGKMFEKPFTLAITGLSITSAPQLAIASFEQTWQSDTYRDQGKKRLIFVKEGERLLISREEMLRSETAVSGALKAVSFEQAALATKTLDSFVLLIPGKASIAWAVDHPRYISNERAQRAVSAAALPATLRQHFDARYEVFDRSGARCEATPRGFQLMVHIIPHFGMVNFWEGRMLEEGEKPVIIPNDHRALMLWRTGTGPYETETNLPGVTLGLEMAPTERCPNPVWGRVMREGSPAPWSVSVPEGAELKLLEAAAIRHPVVLRFDREAREALTVAAPGRWFHSVAAGTPRVLRGPAGAVLYYAEADGNSDCSSTTPIEVGLLFRQHGDRLVPIDIPLYPRGLIQAAVDLDGDGQVEFVAETSIMTKALQGYTQVVDLSPLYLDCPC